MYGTIYARVEAEWRAFAMAVSCLMGQTTVQTDDMTLLRAFCELQQAALVQRKKMQIDG